MASKRGSKPPEAEPAGRARAPSLLGLGMSPVVAAAWLYYQDQLTQSEVADLLAVSRATVVNLLSEARRSGLVQVSIDMRQMALVTSARRLCERFGLEDCVVIPDDGDATSPSERVGAAGARFLASLLENGDRVGISYGRTLMALSKAMPTLSLPDVEVIQITGSMNPKNAFSPELCTLNVASRTGGHCNNLHAPMFVSSAEIRDILMAEPALASHFELMRSCNRVVFGVADIRLEGTIYDSGIFMRRDIEPYIAQGAVSIICSHFVDARGRPVPGFFEDKLIGITMAELLAIPQRICVSGGADKIAALHAVLLAGSVTHLVTDEPTAAAVLTL
jgi:DNA-binding transcriptional regulator LsrR (DeoR family)